MKTASSVLICASVLSALLASSGAYAAVDEQVKREKHSGLMGFFKEKIGASDNTDPHKEDEFYWARLMQETMSVAPPTPPPPTGTPPTPGTGTTPPTTPPTMAPTEECDITIDIACIPIELNETSCEFLPPLVTICEERPSWMQFKYYGGDCSQSANTQQPGKFFCEDFAPIPQGVPAYIRATYYKNEDTIYFEGTVEWDGIFNLTEPNGDRLPADMNFTVYDSEGGTLLQRVQYHSSCSQNLFLKDRYGANQLVGFYNPLQGLVDCFVTSNYTFTFGNNGTFPATLESLVVLTTPFGPFNLTDDVLGQMLMPGESFEVYLPIELDLTVRQRYTVLATITGNFFDNGITCSSSDFLDFVAGGTTTPSVPTVAPTTVPL